MGHGPFLIPLKTLLLFLIAVLQENGIIHGYTKLKHCCQSFCNIRNLSEKDICSKVIEDCHADAEQKQKDIEKVRDLIYDLLSGWFKSIDYYIKQQIIPIKSCQNKNQ